MGLGAVLARAVADQIRRAAGRRAAPLRVSPGTAEPDPLETVPASYARRRRVTPTVVGRQRPPPSLIQEPLPMHSIIYLVGLVVVVMFILSFAGLA